MKNNFRHISIYVLVFTFLVLTPDMLLSQSKAKFYTGFGFQELFHGGFRFQSDQMQYGVFYGFIPDDSDGAVYSLGADIYYHYAGFSIEETLKPAYLRFIINYFHDESRSEINKYSYIHLRLGREMKIAPKVGFSMDGGFGIKTYHKEIKKQSANSWFDIDIDATIIPSFSLSLFFKL